MNFKNWYENEFIPPYETYDLDLTTICKAAFMAGQKATEDKIFEAIGWAYADCCAALDRKDDPRKADLADVVKRAEKDLKIGLETE